MHLTFNPGATQMKYCKQPSPEKKKKKEKNKNKKNKTNRVYYSPGTFHGGEH